MLGPREEIKLQSENYVVQAISSGNSIVRVYTIALGIGYKSVVGPVSIVPKALD